MDAQERVLMTLRHEEPDRVPAFEIVVTNNTIWHHFGVNPSANLGDALKSLRFIPFRNKLMWNALGNRKFIAAGLRAGAKFYQAAGLDLSLSNTAPFPRKLLKGGQFIDECGRHMRFEYAPDGSEILGYVEGGFKSFEDYESWELPDPAWEGRLNNYLAGADVQRELENEVYIIPTTTGLLEVTWEGFGMNIFARILQKPAQAQKVFDDRGKFAVEMVKILAENGAQVVLIYDDWGFKDGLFMSPRQFRQYVLPWMKKICDTAHKRDCKIILHSDGDLMSILPELVGTGVDALNPIESTTANPEYNIFKIKEQYSDRLTLIGNLSPVMLALGDLADIEAYAKRLLRECAPGGGYIYAAGHTINPAVTLDRFLLMLEIRKKY